jgi:ribose 5-phosphate isomerase B
MVEKNKILAIGSDHAGYELKKLIIPFLEALGYKIKDFGAFSIESVDYPDIAHPLAFSIEDKTCVFGILICGTGNGVNMAANKHKGIRSALCWNKEIARFAIEHNNANIIALPARFINFTTAKEIIETALFSSFEAGRHQLRVEKINC